MNAKNIVVLLLIMLSAGLAAYFAHNKLRSDTSALALQRGHYEQAAVHLRKDADNGDIAALTMLANLHQLGLGVPRRPDKSVVLYSEAAFAGDIAARVNLGHAYSQGQGVIEDASLAYAWYNLARNSGSPVAQVYMSELLAATIKNFTKLH